MGPMSSERRQTANRNGFRPRASIPDEVPWNVWEAGALLFLFMLLQVPIGFVGGTLQLFLVCATELTMAAIVLLFLAQRAPQGLGPWQLVALNLPSLKRFILGSIRPAAAGVAAMVALTMIQARAIQYFHIEWPQQEMVTVLRTADSPLQLALIATAAIVLAPVAEELVFRGLLYLPLRAKLGPLAGTLVVSALFAGIHVNLVAFIPLFVLAVLFTALLESTGSLVTAMVAHAVHNAVTVVIILSARTVA